jgi:hypothetical protein
MKEAGTFREALIKTQQGAEAMMNLVQSLCHTDAMSDTSAGHLLAALSHDKRVARDALLSSSASELRFASVPGVRHSQGVSNV